MGRDRAIPNKGDIQTFNGFDWVPLSVAGAILSAGSLNLVDSITSIVDETDASKGFKIQAGTQNTGITTTLDVGAQAANRTLLIPVLGGTDTIVTLATAQTITGAKTFSAGIVANSTLAVAGASTTAAITATSATGLTTLAAATQDALRIIGRAGGTGSFIGSLTVPVLAGSVTYTLPATTTTLAGLGVAQTFTAAQTFSGAVVVNDNALTIKDETDATKTLVFSLGSMATGNDLIISAGAQIIDSTVSFPPMAATDVIVTTGTAQTITGAKTFSAALSVTNATAATSPSTGALIVAGGVGIGSKSYVSGSVTTAADGQLNCTDSANANKRLRFGFDGTSNIGWLQATEDGVANRPLHLNPNGSNVVIGGAAVLSSTLAVTGVATIGTIGVTFAGNIIAGVQDGTAASSGQVGQVIESVVSTATNAAATGTYLALASITLEGDWLISGWVESIPNGATLTVDGATELVIGTTTASAAGSVVGDDRVTENHPIIAGVRHQIVIAHKRVNPSTATTYYLNVLATFTVGTPQWVGTIRATRQR